jgi:parvulin-like peptidyl-prolyl isomerase
MRIRRIVIIAAVVFLAGISSWVGYEYYKDHKSSVEPLREVMIEVNGVNFTMEYFIKLFDSYTAGMNSTLIYNYADYITNYIADNIINAELLRQGAESLNITVTPAEVDARLKEYGYDESYRDMVRAVLLHEKLNEEYFGPQLPNTMEQAHVQVMFVESQEIATELIGEIKAGGNFTALAKEFSCNSSVEGDLGWLPEELMPNTLIANAAFNFTVGELSQPISDESATKSVGYWLIEVTDKQDDEIEARAMLLGSEAEAERVKAELVSGNFSSLAKEYSQHKSKTAGGELGWLTQGEMGSNAFDQVAFNLTVNEVSEPVKDESVQTTGGYWLVKVIDRGDHELEETVKQELIDKHFNDWLAEWTEESTIETYLEADKISWAVNKVLAGR